MRPAGGAEIVRTAIATVRFAGGVAFGGKNGMDFLAIDPQGSERELAGEDEQQADRRRERLADRVNKPTSLSPRAIFPRERRNNVRDRAARPA